MKKLGVALMALFVFAACSGRHRGDAIDAPDVEPDGELSPEPDVDLLDDADVGGDEGDGADVPVGTASMSFVVTYGPNAKTQFSSLWAPSVPGYDGDGPLVFMLCESADPTCQSPVLLREVTAAEREDQMIQNSFGPDVALTALPEGDFLFMLFEDSTDSRARGFGWQDDFATRESDWAGVVSESDLMLVAENDSPANAYNPAPAARPVSLRNGQTLELGDLWLAHYHQRDISVLPSAENGRLAVAVEKGVRLVELDDFGVASAYEFGGQTYYDYVMLDDADEAVQGRVCGMIRGGGNVIYLLYLDASGQNAGFAIAFDAVARQQLGRTRVLFPGDAQDYPCRGTYHEHEGHAYLWVTNASGPDAAAEGLWYANVDTLATADVTAGVLDAGDDVLYRSGIDQMIADGDTLYLAVDTALEPCNAAACVVKADFDPLSGAPAPRRIDTAYDAFVGLPLNAGTTNAQGEIGCVTTPLTPGLAIAPFHDGRKLLFLGLCLEVQVFDLTSGEKLDYNGAAPGRPGIDASLFGQGFVNFSLAPDGNTLWAVSNDKSVVHLYFQRGLAGNRQSYNRWMFLPIDLTSGALPGVAAAWSVANLDGYEGIPESSVGTYDSPAIDPGLDLDFAFLKQYIVNWAGDLAGATPTSIPVGPTIAVAGHTLWLRGSGIPGVSGLANQGNLATFSLSEGQVVLWKRGEAPFYAVWTSGVDTPWGFDLTPESNLDVATYGLAFFPL